MYNEWLDLLYIQWAILSTSLMFAILGITFIHVSSSEKEFLGFVPIWIEGRYGVESKLYKLFTCSNCMAGQIAFWCGLPYALEWGITRYVCQISLAIFWVVVIKLLLHRK